MEQHRLHFRTGSLLKCRSPFNHFSGTLVEDFHLVWLKVITTRQEWSSEWGTVAVTSWWTVDLSKVWVRMCVGRGVCVNVKVVSSSKCRSITKATVCSILVRIILSWWPKCYWSPAWLVHQRENESSRTGKILITGS